MINKTIKSIKELPHGHFRIHWPQYQVLMDIKSWDDEVILCSEDAVLFDLPTVALPNYWMSHVREELGAKTLHYINFINGDPVDVKLFYNSINN